MKLLASRDSLMHKKEVVSKLLSVHLDHASYKPMHIPHELCQRFAVVYRQDVRLLCGRSREPARRESTCSDDARSRMLGSREDFLKTGLFCCCVNRCPNLRSWGGCLSPSIAKTARSTLLEVVWVIGRPA